MCLDSITLGSYLHLRSIYGLNMEVESEKVSRMNSPPRKRSTPDGSEEGHDVYREFFDNIHIHSMFTSIGEDKLRAAGHTPTGYVVFGDRLNIINAVTIRAKGLIMNAHSTKQRPVKNNGKNLVYVLKYVTDNGEHGRINAKVTEKFTIVPHIAPSPEKRTRTQAPAQSPSTPKSNETVATPSAPKKAKAPEQPPHPTGIRLKFGNLSPAKAVFVAPTAPVKAATAPVKAATTVVATAPAIAPDNTTPPKEFALPQPVDPAAAAAKLLQDPEMSQMYAVLASRIRERDRVDFARRQGQEEEYLRNLQARREQAEREVVAYRDQALAAVTKHREALMAKIPAEITSQEINLREQAIVRMMKDPKIIESAVDRLTKDPKIIESATNRLVITEKAKFAAALKEANAQSEKKRAKTAALIDPTNSGAVWTQVEEAALAQSLKAATPAEKPQEVKK